MDKNIDINVMKYRDSAMNRSLGSALLVVLWLLGIKIATGFWAVFFAIFTPYGGYLAVEAIAKFIGIIV